MNLNLTRLACAVSALVAISPAWAAGAVVSAHISSQPSAAISTTAGGLSTPQIALPVSLPVSANARVGVSVNTPGLQPTGLLQAVSALPGLSSAVTLPDLPVDPSKLVGTVLNVVPSGAVGGLPVDAAALNSLIIAATKVPATVLTLVPAGQLPALSVSSLQTLLNSTLTSLPVQPGEVLALVQGTASGALSMIPLGTLPSTAALTSSLTGAIPPQLMGTVVSVVRMVPVATVTRTVSGAVNKLSVSTIAQTVSATANVLPIGLFGMSNTITALLPSNGGSANSDAHSSLLLISGLDIDLLGAAKFGVGISLTAP